MADSWEGQWERLTIEANDFLNDRKYIAALDKFQNAFHLVEKMIDNEITSMEEQPDLLDLYIMACYNVANSYWKLGELDLAEYYFHKAHYQVLKITQKLDENSLLRKNALTMSGKTLETIWSFYKKIGKEDKIQYVSDVEIDTSENRQIA